MKVFLDSDVILDFLTAREPYHVEIERIMHLGITKKLELFTSSLIIANIHYFISKTENRKQATIKIEKLLNFIKVLNVGQKEITDAISSTFSDFEDAIQKACANNSKLKIIITRNIKDFKKSKLSILTPKEFLLLIELK